MASARRFMAAWICLAAGLAVPLTAEEASDRLRTVVFMQPASTQREAMAACLRHFTEGLRREFGKEFTVVSEDVPSNGWYRESMAGWMREKHAGRQVDLVVSVETPGSITGIELRSRLWPQTPLLLTGITSARLEAVKDRSNVTALTLNQDIPAFLSAVHGLMPQAREVVFVSGAYFPAARDRAAWLQDASAFATEKGLGFRDLSGRGLPEVLTQLKSMPRTAMILYREPVAAGMREHSVETELAAQAVGPLFAAVDASVGEGVTGAVRVDYARLGEELATHAGAVLRAGSAAAVPPAASRAFLTTWDWRQLQRWRLDERRLPPGADVQFRRPGLWEANRPAMLGITAAIMVQGFLIAGLLVQRRLRRRAEELLHRERSHLAHTQRVATVNQMAAALTHELNQPLTAMVNNAGAALRLLRSGPERAAECCEILTDIETDGRHAGALLRNTRDMLRPAVGDLQHAGIGELIEAALRMTAPECAARGVTVSAEVVPGLPLLELHPVQIQQVLVNLLLNALDAASAPEAAGSAIHIRAWATAREILVRVRDFGPGLPPGDPAQWFEEFRTTKPGGMGMGLSISRHIIESHGGSIRAENAAGGGACFTFTLPLKSSLHP